MVICDLCREHWTPTDCPSTMALFNLDANAAYLTINVDKCGKMCGWGLLTATSAAMHTNYVLEGVSVPQSSLSNSLCLSLFCVFVSRSTLPVFEFVVAVASLLTLRSHFSEASTRGKGWNHHVNSGCMAKTKGTGGGRYLLIYFKAY